MHLAKPKELLILEALQHRTELSPYQQKSYASLKYHYQLELQFSMFLQEIHPDHIIWHFNYFDNHHESLVNAIIFAENALHLFKLNHYSGLHYINEIGMLADYFTDEVKMDIVQLNCIKYSIHQLIPVNCPIYIHAVCLNESFELDCKTPNQHFLFAKDIAPFISNEILSKPFQKKTNHFKQLITALRFYKIFHFQNLAKGLKCPHCHTINKFTFHHHLARCHTCGHIHTMDQLLHDAAKEYRLLYPDQPLTQRLLNDWCAERIPKHKIALFLKNNFQSVGHTKGRYYLDLNIP